MKYLLTLFILVLTLYGTDSKQHKYTNSLINENSPYLLQHAHNPINWYAWNKNSLQKAKNEDKLIFLSIGYSTCHWCHVMEKESFEDENLAKIFNKNYISIKIDREIDSHLDVYYQEILSSFKTRRNGWPLNAILTPELKVLHITTYIPPTAAYGTEGLDTMLTKYAKLYKNDKNRLKEIISKNQKMILDKNSFVKKDDKDLSHQYIKAMMEVYDDGFKGFFKRPKFPLSANLTLLYDIYDISNNKQVSKMVYETLTAMAKGGIYDQVEGAFFRYSVHPDWIIPHYEKMLYTTAELVPLYTRAYNDTKDPLYKKVVIESLNEIKNRFSKDDLFYSASNADSPNGVEGEYFNFDYDIVFEELLKKGFSEDEAQINLEYFDITEVGNFEDTFSNPHLNNNIDLDEEQESPKRLEETLKVLKEIRKTKEYPFIDKKIITAWNAMMIKAYLKAGSIDKRYEMQGFKSLDTLIEKLFIKNTLYHYRIDNKTSPQKALLEDYAFLIDTLITAYEIKYEKKYLNLAQRLSNQAYKKFFINNTWYLNNTILKAKVNFVDRYYTSAISKMYENLLTIANYDFNLSLLYKVKKMIQNHKDEILSDISNHPNGVKVLIRLKQGDVILKSKKHNLLRERDKIKTLNYPFLFTKATNDNDFLACDESTCFSYDVKIDKILQKVSKRINK